MRGSPVAVAVDTAQEYAVLVGGGGVLAAGPIDQVASTMRRLEESEGGPPRWVWWQADAARPFVRTDLRLSRSWDLREVHRLLVGGLAAAPDVIWATAHGLNPDGRPSHRTGDLFDVPSDGAEVVQADGYLAPDVLADDWLRGEEHLRTWGTLALQVAERQQGLLHPRPHALATGASESGAALLCVELEERGLPIDRARMESLIEAAAGPRPRTEADGVRTRTARDLLVLQRAPGFERTDLRNPAEVKRMLHGVGVRVDDTRAHHLEPYRHTHPVVDALLDWRKAERIATTYGWGWLAEHVGADDRLRGAWTACDGGAGRMTAGAGLHSLPTPLREGVAAAPGHLLVRADLGQVEPRVLAVVSGDPVLARATAADDLYAQVAQQLAVDRPTAKIAVLAAMYGQTTGPAAGALERMERSYPVAMAFLRDAAARGERGEAVTTYGGRLIPVRAATEPPARRAMGRFTRNAVVQGAAAELFKAWALTARKALLPLGAEIVLCLHDELLIQVPLPHAERAAVLVQETLGAAAHHWSGGMPVRFVADIRVIARWSQAKE
ncbi:DNA polymerase [Leekyejoonella antrihumi]|uniref:DNA-directed DNA polymerase n=1 Tax=Leekyejoonella antrihumi TaxID=1660198 RepID=A0A563DYC8_9MICO|nr:DNA polymerase [Leekyejoonella antrihumi]TWP35205.1 DNA polymerase I [Leekyejoonella antrihumi]